jgi:hypothetical protein
MSKTFKPRKSPFKIVSILLILALAATSVFFYLQYKDAKSDDLVKEHARIIEAVGSQTELPEEDPAISQIDNINELADQEFFEDADNGDWLLMYPSTNQAFIYREDGDRIINVGPFVFESASTESSTTTTTTAPASETASVVIVAENNDSNNTTARLNTDFAGRVNVTQVASETPITTTVLVVNNEAFSGLADEIAPIVDGAVGTAPAGQPAQEGDIIIYLAN